MSFGGLLGHQGDSGSTGLDGQAALDGALGRVQVVQRVPVPDGQMVAVAIAGSAPIISSMNAALAWSLRLFVSPQFVWLPVSAKGR